MKMVFFQEMINKSPFDIFIGISSGQMLFLMRLLRHKWASAIYHCGAFGLVQVLSLRRRCSASARYCFHFDIIFALAAFRQWYSLISSITIAWVLPHDIPPTSCIGLTLFLSSSGRQRTHLSLRCGIHKLKAHDMVWQASFLVNIRDGFINVRYDFSVIGILDSDGNEIWREVPVSAIQGYHTIWNIDIIID